MGGPDRLVCMAAALREKDFSAGMVHQDPQEFACCVACRPYDPNLYLTVESHLQFLFKFLSLVLMGCVIDPQRG